MKQGKVFDEVNGKDKKRYSTTVGLRLPGPIVGAGGAGQAGAGVLRQGHEVGKWDS